jgi:hypothetical protein
MPGIYTHEPYLWVHICELALAEQRPECRKHLLIEARKALLQRARGLEDTHGSDLECATLETAVAVLDVIDPAIDSAKPNSFDAMKVN